MPLNNADGPGDGTATCDQTLPFQFSARPVIGVPVSPTALQTEVEGHETAARLLDGYGGGLGESWIVQFTPFQRSTTDGWLPLGVSSSHPTAVHARADTHDTPLKNPPRSSGGFGTAWIDQPRPVQRSAATIPPFPPGPDPTAIQPLADQHDTLRNVTADTGRDLIASEALADAATGAAPKRHDNNATVPNVHRPARQSRGITAPDQTTRQPGYAAQSQRHETCIRRTTKRTAAARIEPRNPQANPTPLNPDNVTVRHPAQQRTTSGGGYRRRGTRSTSAGVPSSAHTPSGMNAASRLRPLSSPRRCRPGDRVAGEQSSACDTPRDPWPRQRSRGAAQLGPLLPRLLGPRPVACRWRSSRGRGSKSFTRRLACGPTRGTECAASPRPPDSRGARARLR
jgi:hypothetical protein